MLEYWYIVCGLLRDCSFSAVFPKQNHIIWQRLFSIWCHNPEHVKHIHCIYITALSLNFHPLIKINNWFWRWWSMIHVAFLKLCYEIQNVALVQKEIVPEAKLNYNMYIWLTWIGEGLVNPALSISAMISAATSKMCTSSYNLHNTGTMLMWVGDIHCTCINTDHKYAIRGAPLGWLSKMNETYGNQHTLHQMFWPDWESVCLAQSLRSSQPWFCCYQI